MATARALSGVALRELRRQARREFGDECAVQTVADATGARTTIATVACQVVGARSSDGPEYFGDQRMVRVSLPFGTDTAGADLIAVTGGATYRIVTQDPPRSDALAGAVDCVEAREPGGPV
jgi:hypothetical protein